MVRTKARRRTRLMVAAAASGTFLVWQQVQATRYGYEVEKARLEVRRLRETILYDDLRWQKAVAPAQLAHHARTSLGMQPVSLDSIRILENVSPSDSGPALGPWPRRVLHAVQGTLSRVDALASALRRPT
ncbi:MAG: hypothetical protein HY927_12950 [Elusimicrobia bacterium]|nr:hypothetical protein [Elusimicrobiota bacterium]